MVHGLTPRRCYVVFFRKDLYCKERVKRFKDIVEAAVSVRMGMLALPGPRRISYRALRSYRHRGFRCLGVRAIQVSSACSPSFTVSGLDKLSC